MKTQSKTIAVVVAHPDDEVLGCGGTIARHCAAGDDVQIIFLADGVTARGGDEGREEREQAAEKAASILGVKATLFLSLPDNRMDSLPLIEIIQPLEKQLKTIAPDVIFTHHHGDLNIDHRLTHQAVMTACRPIPGTKLEAIFGMEVLSSTEWATPEAGSAFLPVRAVDITDTLALKVEALQAYDMEMRAFPHARSYQAVEAQAKLRGAQAGLEAAEAFTVIREIIR